MFKYTLKLIIICILFSGEVFASLEGEWIGQEFIKATVKVRNISLPQFMVGTNTAIFNYKDDNNTVTFSNGFGTFHGVFTDKVKVKQYLILNHSFKVKLDKTELAAVFLESLNNVFGPDWIVSDIKISKASAKGNEFNELDVDFPLEQEHALHGSYKIVAKFRIADAFDPSFKLGASISFDVDFAEFRPQGNTALQQSFPQSSDAIFKEPAKRIKILLQKQVAR